MTTQAPVETGTRIATIDRGPGEELRIVWAEYKGNPYIGLRVWTQDRQGRWWPDKMRGVSIRVRELGQVAEAIGIAIDHAEEIRAGWTDLPADHPRLRAVQGRRLASGAKGGKLR